MIARLDANGGSKDLTENPRWRKASRSTNTANCVEVAHTRHAVRDSKNPSGPVLAVDAGLLVDAVRADRLDRRTAA